MKDMRLKAKLVSILAALGILTTGLFSYYMYQQRVEDVYVNARETANNLVSRSVEMFMVSTVKFHEEFQQTSNDPEKRKMVLDDWNRTIFAVDEAVVHDHGPGRPRGRLIGDEAIFNYKPLDNGSTDIQIPFEREAGKALMTGKDMVEVFRPICLL